MPLYVGGGPVVSALLRPLAALHPAAGGGCLQSGTARALRRQAPQTSTFGPRAFHCRGMLTASGTQPRMRPVHGQGQCSTPTHQGFGNYLGLQSAVPQPWQAPGAGSPADARSGAVAAHARVAGRLTGVWGRRSEERRSRSSSRRQEEKESAAEQSGGWGAHTGRRPARRWRFEPRPQAPAPASAARLCPQVLKELGSNGWRELLLGPARRGKQLGTQINGRYCSRASCNGPKGQVSGAAAAAGQLSSAPLTWQTGRRWPARHPQSPAARRACRPTLRQAQQGTLPVSGPRNCPSPTPGTQVQPCREGAPLGAAAPWNPPRWHAPWLMPACPTTPPALPAPRNPPAARPPPQPPPM